MLNRTLRLYRNAYRGLPGEAWLLALVMLINRSGTMVLPYLTLYMTQELHYSVTEAGVVMAVYGAGALVGTFLGGRLTDRLGFYNVQFLSLLVAGFFLVGLQFVTDMYALCGFVFGYTLLGDAFRPANSAAIAFYSTPENRTRAYSLNRLAINLGWSVGGGLGGLLAGINYHLLFWVDGLTCIAAAVVLRLFLAPPVTAPCTAQEAAGPPAPVRSAYRDPLFLAFAGFTFLFALAFMQLFSLLPLYFKETLGMPETQIGLLMTLNGLLIVGVEMALVYSIEQRWPGTQTRFIALGVVLTGFSYAMLNLGPWAGLAVISVIFNTFGEILAMPFMQSFAVNRASPQNRGQYLALYAMAYALAQITAPALGSQIVARAGFPTLWTLMALISALSAGGFWWLSQKLKTRAVASEALVND